MQPWEAKARLNEIIAEMEGIARRMQAIREEGEREREEICERCRQALAAPGRRVPGPGKEILTTTEAVALGYFANREEAYRLRKSGRGPRYAQRGRRVTYRRADLDAWVRAQTVVTADTLPWEQRSGLRRVR